jgi:hypothetical protein
MTKVTPFLSRYKIEDRGYATPCWIWQGATYGSGYGTLTVAGKQMGAHVYSYKTYVGPLEPHQRVLHYCDVPLCIRPDHLYQGTQKKNLADAVSKGRFKAIAGEHHARHKLTDEQIERIRELASEGHTQKQIALWYGVCHQQVSKLLRGERRTHSTLVRAKRKPWQSRKPGPSQRSKSVEDLFWEKIDKTGDDGFFAFEGTPCWIWTRAVQNQFYGQFDSNRLPNGKKHALAHKFAWEIANGSVPEGMHVHHRCRLRRCCNPSHLSLLTAQEDSAERSRLNEGRVRTVRVDDPWLERQKMRDVA